MQFKTLADRGYLVKGPDGKPRIFSPGEGDVDAWKVAALDFTNPGLGCSSNIQKERPQMRSNLSWSLLPQRQP